jgi:hypothetical protein
MRLAAVVLVSTLFGCGGSSFNGSNEQQPAEQQPIIAQQTPTPGCTVSELISIRPRSELVIDQQAANRAVTVVLTFKPCPNQTTPLELPIWFDLDAVVVQSANRTSGVKSLPYQLAAAGSTTTQGNLTQKVGQDLFGHTGNEWAHYESDQPLRVSSQLTTADFTVQLHQTKILAPSGTNGTPATGPMQIPMHVRVGNSQPVTGQVTFSAP